MRVARLHGVNDVRLHAEPLPEVAEGSSLVRVASVGLCGSDLHWYSDGGIGDATLRSPLALGHEFSGVIEGGPRNGERVAVDPAIPCRRCETCAEGNRNLCPDVVFAGHGSTDGGLREYVAWPDRQLITIPNAISYDAAAVLEPLGVAVHAIDLGHIRLGATVAVVGCGPIGLLLLQAVRAAGAARVVAIEPLPHRRDAARRFGADAVLDVGEAREPSLLRDALTPRGADVVFDVVGSTAAIDTAMHAARPGGRVVLVGIPDEDRTEFTASIARRKGLTIAVARRMKDVYARSIQLVVSGAVDATFLVTHRFELAQADAAFRSAAAREGLKVIVDLGAWTRQG